MSTLPSDLALTLGGDDDVKTLSNLIALVRLRGDARNTVRFPDDYLQAEIQAAFAEGYELIESVHEGFFDQYDTVSTVAHQAFVPLPAGPPVCWIVRAVDVLVGTEYTPVPRIGIKDRLRYGNTEGRPCGHRLTARGLDLFPTPDQVYTLRILNTPAAPILDSSAREYYNSWEEYSVFGALVRLFLTQGRDASDWQKQLDRTAARMIKAASSRNESGPEYLNLREGVSGEWGGENPDAWRPGF